MKNKFELSSIDMATFLIMSMFGVRILTLPRILAYEVEAGSWVSVLIAGFITMVLSFMMYWFNIKHPGKNGSEIVLITFGKYIGTLGIFMISIHTLGAAGLGLRLFGDTIKLYLLAETPFYAVAGLMIVVSFYAFNNGLKSITALVNILLPTVMALMVVLLLIPLTKADTTNMMNPFALGVVPLIRNFVPALDALYGFTILTYLMPYFKEPKGVKKWIVVGIGIPTFVYTSIVLLCVLVFGDDEMEWLLYPTVTLVKSIQLKTQILERAESLLISVWIIIVFMLLVFSFFVGYLNTKALIKTKEGTLKDRLVRYGQIAILVAFTVLPQDVVQQKTYGEYIQGLGRILMLGFIPAIVAVTAFKERKKNHEK
jgi:spore germination protein